MKDSARKAMMAKKKESYDEMINQTQQEKNERSINAIHYYINGNNATSSKYSQRDASYIFGITEQKFRRDWKKFKEENKLIYKNGFYSFRDSPKYPSDHITRTRILP